MSVAVLYTPQVLALAVELAGFPLGDAQPLRAQARSASCGSTIELGLSLEGPGRIIGSVGLRCHACAIGQGSAALFARSAPGKDAAAILDMAGRIERWLKGEEALPDWPGLSTIAAARDYPARHGALMLPWNAARTILTRDVA